MYIVYLLKLNRDKERHPQIVAPCRWPESCTRSWPSIKILIRPMDHPAQPESIVKSKKEKKRSTSDGYNARERAVGQKESQERNSSLRNSEAVGKEMQVERQSLCK
jgi:hypothetical protein